MLFKRIKSNKDISDHEFDKVYPKSIRTLSDLHFTSVKVAKLASDFLCEKSNPVLDIGAGVGKFCMIGSSWTKGEYIGVEQRANLCEIANQVIERYELDRVSMVNANILDIPFSEFKSFYFFNAFHENICKDDPIDQSTDLGRHLYDAYVKYMREELDSMPQGTRLVTYYGFLKEVPKSYKLVHEAEGGPLKFWERS